ncbi:NUDIX hydrolase [Streptomyces phaeochromogenes]|nr:NUDIX hydrolase [Streptomyces phaeochromogenes]
MSGLALIPIYRYPIGAVSLEFPRGGCEIGEDLETAAVRELREETGLTALSLRGLGELHAETGIVDSVTHVFLASVQSTSPPQANPEVTESLSPPVWLLRHQLVQKISQNHIKCGLTLAAFALAIAQLEEPVTRT